MKGACSLTRAAVAESEGGSGFESWASLYISFRIPSDKLVVEAVAWDAFLFKMPLDDADTLLAFRVAATLFADTRRAIIEEGYGQRMLLSCPVSR